MMVAFSFLQRLLLGGVAVCLATAAPLGAQGAPPAPGDKSAQQKDKNDKKEKVPELVERIRMVIRFGHSQQVRDSLRRVSELKEGEQKSLIKDIRSRLEGADPLLQVAVAQMVSKVKWSDLDADIVSFMKSDVNEVIFSTCAVIKKKEIKAAIPHLQKYLSEADYQKEDNHKISEFLQLAGHFQVSSLSDHLFEKLKDDTVDLSYRYFIASYFGKLPSASAEVKEYMISLLSDEKANVRLRAHAASALGEMKHRAAADVIKKELDKINAQTDIDKKKLYAPLRVALIGALIRMGDSDVAKVLINMARDDDPVVRLSAIRQLGRLKDRKFIDILKYKAKYDPSLKVQAAAKKALEEIQGKSPEN